MSAAATTSTPPPSQLTADTTTTTTTTTTVTAACDFCDGSGCDFCKLHEGVDDGGAERAPTVRANNAVDVLLTWYTCFPKNETVCGGRVTLEFVSRAWWWYIAATLVFSTCCEVAAIAIDLQQGERIANYVKIGAKSLGVTLLVFLWLFVRTYVRPDFDSIAFPATDMRLEAHTDAHGRDSNTAITKRERWCDFYFILHHASAFNQSFACLYFFFFFFRWCDFFSHHASAFN